MPKFILGSICSCFSFLAGFVFRPDNFEVLNIFPVVANNKAIKENAKNIHAYSNITSVLAAIATLTLP